MRISTRTKTIIPACCLTLATTAMVFAGAMALEIANPAGNAEAQREQAVLVARVTACHSPEKTTLTGTAEGWENGHRKSVTLTLIPLATPGTFAVTRQWPSEGAWAIRLVATNPDYANYATGALLRVHGSTVDWERAKRLFRAPSEEDVTAMLAGRKRVIASTAPSR